tara:strand:- start:456 stop:563 length:108 start_codon:yes stop_codon:yes gene_type:complete
MIFEKEEGWSTNKNQAANTRLHRPYSSVEEKPTPG